MSSTKRTGGRPPFEGQKGRCAWCGTEELPKGRSSWCSEECVEAYKISAWPSHIRNLVKRRDKGICAICGCDAEKEFRAWREQANEISRLAYRLISDANKNLVWVPERSRMEFRSQYEGLPHFSPHGKEGLRFKKYMMEKYNPGRWTGGRTSGWDADHIIPVVEGGGECDLSNYRTLCHPCHKGVTADLAKRTAAKRKQQKSDESTQH